MSGGFLGDISLCNDTEAGSVPASTSGTTVPIGSGAYGSWTQLVASTSADCSAVQLWTSFLSGPSYNCVWRIGVGASGSEVAVASGFMPLMSGSGGSDTWAHGGILPLNIPAGSRISASAKGSSGDTAKCKLNLWDGGFTRDGFAGFDEIGSVTSLSPSATANTMGSWSQVTASSARDYAGLQISIDNHAGAGTYALNIGIGASGSEITIAHNIMFNPAGSLSIYIPVEILAGTRIAVQCQSSGTSSPAVSAIYLAGAYK